MFEEKATMNKDPKYEIRTGLFGQYFYDTANNRDMPLSTVLEILNDHERVCFSACDELYYDEWGHQSCKWRVPAEQTKEEKPKPSPSDLCPGIDYLDVDYIKRLVDLGRQAKKIPWSCSMYHQDAVAQILRNEGITDEMTMEESNAFVANKTVEEPPVLLDADGNKCSIQRAKESLQLCKLNITRLQKQIYKYQAWESRRAQQKSNKKNG